MNDLLSHYGDAAPALRRLAAQHANVQGPLLTASIELRHAITMCALVAPGDDEGLAGLIRARDTAGLIKKAWGPRTRLSAAMLRRLGSAALDRDSYTLLATMMSAPKLARQVTHLAKTLNRRDLVSLSAMPDDLRDTRLLRFQDFSLNGPHMTLLISLIESACPAARRENILASLFATKETCIDDWARAFLMTHTQLPTDGAPSSERLTPIRTVEDLVAAGREFQNCLGHQVSDILRGRRSFGIYRDTDRAVVEFRRWVPVGWYAHDIFAFNNRPIRRALDQRVREHLTTLGVHTLPRLTRAQRFGLPNAFYALGID